MPQINIPPQPTGKPKRPFTYREDEYWLPVLYIAMLGIGVQTIVLVIG